jgi:hypothetical protein
MPTTIPPMFEKFWKAYPRKVAKKPALTAWIKQDVEADMYGAKAAVDDLEKRTRLGWWNKDKTKIPHPASWINAQRWHDEGWAEEIAGHDRQTERPRHRVPDAPERIVPWEEAMLGRLFLTYVSIAHGLPDDARSALKIRVELMRDVVPELRTDIEAETMTHAELGEMLGNLFLARMDHAYSLNLKDRVMNMARRRTA